MDDEETLLVLQPQQAQRRRVWLYVLVAICSVLLLFLAVPSAPREKIAAQVSDLIETRLKTPVKSRIDYHKPGVLNEATAPYAYATLLTHDVDKEDESLEDDNYFIAVRMLIYQLLYAPETKTQLAYPFIVMVNQDVSDSKRAQLIRDGAIVWEPDSVEWGAVDQTKVISDYASVLLKLRVWELTQFERICFLDSDTVLNRNMDGIFDDAAVQIRNTGSDLNQTFDDEYKLPSQYVFAGVGELRHEHHWPTTLDIENYYDVNYLNAGFFVIQPSHELMQYYFSLLAIPDRFAPDFPEQNLWNYAHRKEGNMPWQYLALEWNAHFPTVADKVGGVASLHTHWWKPADPNLLPYLESRKLEMEEFFRQRNLIFADLGALS